MPGDMYRGYGLGFRASRSRALSPGHCQHNRKESACKGDSDF